MLIYTPLHTARLQYIMHHILQENMGISYEICTSKEVFDAYEGDKMVYDTHSDYPVWVKAEPLLWERGINSQYLHMSMSGQHTLFAHEDHDLLGFDLFSACFWCLSRYEEYGKGDKDKYGRPYLRYGELYDYPWVEVWIEQFKDALQQHYPHMEYAKKHFTHVPTYDIDIAYCYKGKSLIWDVAGRIKHLLHGKWQLIRDRNMVLQGSMADPYDNYAYLEHLHKAYGLKAIYFFLAATHRSRLDRNTPTGYADMGMLIEQLGKNNHIGLHASYRSYRQARVQAEEIAYLQQHSHKHLDSSRQHYLLLRLPGTPQQLIANGIHKDYSIGPVSRWGYRASTCRPFLFYDLYNERSTTLLCYPLIGMENGIQGHTLEEMWQYIKPWLDLSIQYKGTLCTLFHNQSFGIYADRDYAQLYERMLSYLHK